MQTNTKAEEPKDLRINFLKRRASHSKYCKAATFEDEDFSFIFHQTGKLKED